jgi:hypothetical protein
LLNLHRPILFTPLQSHSKLSNWSDLIRTRHPRLVCRRQKIRVTSMTIILRTAPHISAFPPILDRLVLIFVFLIKSRIECLFWYLIHPIATCAEYRNPWFFFTRNIILKSFFEYTYVQCTLVLFSRQQPAQATYRFNDGYLP